MLAVALVAGWVAAPVPAIAAPANHEGLQATDGSIVQAGAARELAAAATATTSHPEWSLGGLDADAIVGSPANHDHPLLSMLRRRYMLEAAEPSVVTRPARRLQQDSPPPPSPPPPSPPPPSPPLCDCLQFQDTEFANPPPCACCLLMWIRPPARGAGRAGRRSAHVVPVLVLDLRPPAPPSLLQSAIGTASRATLLVRGAAALLVARARIAGQPPGWAACRCCPLGPSPCALRMLPIWLRPASPARLPARPPRRLRDLPAGLLRSVPRESRMHCLAVDSAMGQRE